MLNLYRPRSVSCSREAAATRRDYTLINASVHGTGETVRVPLRHILCVGLAGRVECCLTLIGWPINRLHARHQRCGETLLDQPVVELLGVAWLIWRTSCARLSNEHHRVLFTPCGGDRLAERAGDLFHLPDSVRATMHASGALTFTGISTHKRPRRGRGHMCQAARSIINSACELEQEKTGRNRTVSVGFANHMQGDLLDPASLASRMFARIYLADLALALKASRSLYSRGISGCVPTWVAPRP